MSILSELKSHGIEVVKTDRLFRGVCNTEVGCYVTSVESECDDGIYFLQQNGKIVPCNDRTVYLVSGTGYEGRDYSIEKIEELANDGKILSFKCSDLYAEFYDFENNKELESCFKYGYSSKSRKYIENLMKEIGLIRYTNKTNGSGSDDGVLLSFDKVCEYNIEDSYITEVGNVDGVWIAQTYYWYATDDYVVIRMYFDHKPSFQDVAFAFAIRKFDLKPNEVYKCTDCGKLIHWVDADGNIIEKIFRAEIMSCGCLWMS